MGIFGCYFSVTPSIRCEKHPLLPAEAVLPWRAVAGNVLSQMSGAARGGRVNLVRARRQATTWMSCPATLALVTVASSTSWAVVPSAL